MLLLLKYHKLFISLICGCGTERVYIWSMTIGHLPNASGCNPDAHPSPQSWHFFIFWPNSLFFPWSNNVIFEQPLIFPTLESEAFLRFAVSTLYEFAWTPVNNSQYWKTLKILKILSVMTNYITTWSFENFFHGNWIFKADFKI